MAKGKAENVLVLVAALVVVIALAAAIMWQRGMFDEEGQDGPHVTVRKLDFGRPWMGGAMQAALCDAWAVQSPRDSARGNQLLCAEADSTMSRRTSQL